MSLYFELDDQNHRPVGVTEFNGREIVRNISGWKGGASAGHMSVGGCSLLPVVAREQGVVTSLSVKEGIKTIGVS